MPRTQILITRPRHQTEDFARALRKADFEPVLFPTIDIRPSDDTTALDRTIARLACYDWVVFTSVNAVEMFFERVATISGSATTMQPSQSGGRLLRRAHPEHSELTLNDSDANLPRIAAIGPKTAAALEQRGITPDFVPQKHLAEAILPGLGDLRGRWVLLPSADIAQDTLPKGILQAGGVAHVVTVYHTIPAVPNPEGLSALQSGVDWLTFTSPSTARNFVTLTQRSGLDPFRLPGDPKIACIGPVTAKAVHELGLHVDVIAEPHTVDGMIQAIRAIGHRQ